MEQLAQIPRNADAVVVGGGFYGAAIAIYLAQERKLRHVVLLERETALLKRASYNNQARVHNGYHYPRSFTTAHRSRINFPRFLADWSGAAYTDMTKLYAISRANSRMTAGQFERFCSSIKAPLRPAAANHCAMFDPRLIERVYEAEEVAFDTTALATLAKRALLRAGVTIGLSTSVRGLFHRDGGGLDVKFSQGEAVEKSVRCRYVFNCTYSGLNQLRGDYPGSTRQLKHEVAQMALVKVPECLNRIGITVMDGPFFSLMPFPARSLHTLSHVRYTPGVSWVDAQGIDPYQKLGDDSGFARTERMFRDASRYLPILADAVHIDTIREVKTILVRNEVDDGRPILFERHTALPGAFSVLGGKLDNIYDILQKLDSEHL